MLERLVVTLIVVVVVAVVAIPGVFQALETRTRVARRWSDERVSI